MKTFAAFVLAPLAPMLFAIPYALFMHNEFDAAGPFFFLCVFYGYPALLIFGLPLYLFYRHKKHPQIWKVTLFGGIVGALLPVIIFIPMIFPEPPINMEFLIGTLQVILTGALMGSISGVAFWLLAYMSPNKRLQFDGSPSVRRH